MVPVLESYALWIHGSRCASEPLLLSQPWIGQAFDGSKVVISPVRDALIRTHRWEAGRYEIVEPVVDLDDRHVSRRAGHQDTALLGRCRRSCPRACRPERKLHRQKR